MRSASVIICSRNGVDRMPPLIRSLSQLRVSQLSEIEVVFVDSNSQDGTLDVVRNANLPFPLKYRHLDVPGHSKALNAAIDMSTGELLLFTDDDCSIDVDWASAYLDAAHQVSGAGYFFGRVIPILPGRLPDWWLLAPRSMRGRTQGHEIAVYQSFCRDSYPIGCNMAVRRSAICGGLRFQEKLGPKPDSPVWLGADTKLGWDLQQSGVAGCYVPTAVVYHEVQPARVSWNYLVSHCWASGRCSLYYKPTSSGVGRLHFALSCVLKCAFCSFSFPIDIFRGRYIPAKRTYLSLIKAAAAFWEFASTFGGRMP